MGIFSTNHPKYVWNKNTLKVPDLQVNITLNFSIKTHNFEEEENKENVYFYYTFLPGCVPVELFLPAEQKYVY